MRHWAPTLLLGISLTLILAGKPGAAANYLLEPSAACVLAGGLAAEPVVALSPHDIDTLGVSDGGKVTVTSAEGSITAPTVADPPHPNPEDRPMLQYSYYQDQSTAEIEAKIRSTTVVISGSVVGDIEAGKQIVVFIAWFQFIGLQLVTVVTMSNAISEEIDHKLEDDLRDKRMGIEGYDGSSWLLPMRWRLRVVAFCTAAA